jgi:Tfp pilus assembly protein PilX
MRIIKQAKIKDMFYRGSALAYALVVMSVSMIILVSMLSYISSQLKFSYNRVERQRAFQIAEAGIYFYRWYLAHETSGKTAKEINDFWQGGTALGIAGDYENEFKDSNGEAVGKYIIHVEQPMSNSTIVMAEATGWTYKMPNVQKTVKVRFRRPSWSEFSVLANNFMRFGEGTNVFGKIHSNKGIRFDGTAYNVISSSVANYDDPDHSGGVEFGVHTHVRVPPQTGVSSSGLSSEMPPTNPAPTRSDIFLAGRQFPVPDVSFTGVYSNLDFLKTEAKKPNGTNINNCNSTGCYFDNSGYGRHIIFNSNGTMSVRRVDSFNKSTYDIYNRPTLQGTNAIITQGSVTTYNIPNDGVIFVEDNVWLEGPINNKRVTVAAANLIDGASPGTGNAFLGTTNLTISVFNENNCLGIVAQNNVEILKASQNLLTIDAALLAQNGRVGREYYSCNEWRYRTCRRWLVNGVWKLWNQVTPEERETGSCSDWRVWTDSAVSPSDPSDDYQYCYNSNSGESRDTITINGSIATNLRYGFAYTDGTGYIHRNLNFDNNLVYFPPPYFPTGTEYAIDLWEEL